MDDIKDIIGTIVRGCAQGGVIVSDVLAAFVARTIVESNATTFSLDKSLSQESKDEVIIQSIEKLLEKDSPQLETMKMQVEFDCSFLEEDNNFHKTIRLHKKLIGTSRQHIAELVMHDANDFEALTTLYRKIFRFLLDFVPSDNKQQSSDRVIEREVAAALESVFPRIGLKAFVQLSYDEKTTQLMELGRIVFGIRLFNRHQNRGGVGIDNIEETSFHLGESVVNEINREIELINQLCNKYQEIIVKSHLQKRRNLIKRREYAERKIDEFHDEDEQNIIDPNTGLPIVNNNNNNNHNDYKDYKEKGDKSERKELKANKSYSNYYMNDDEEEEEEEVGDWLINRWSSELANRRQYLAFLRSLSDELSISYKKIVELIESINSELSNLNELVGNKASVSKEQVYPKFDNLASIWLTLWEESKLLLARYNTYLSLKKYKSSYTTALTERMYSTIGRINDLKGDEISLAAATSGHYDNNQSKSSLNLYDSDAKVSDNNNNNNNNKVKNEKEIFDNDDKNEQNEDKDFKSDDKASSIELIHKQFKPAHGSKKVTIEREIYLETTSISGATLLSVNDTPDFMQLPLELQGFCPWTIVNANGLLVPGKPSLGVIRYNNLYYVCEHKIAIKAFMNDPNGYLEKILDISSKCPEYIHLLRLQNYFPTASIARLIDHPEFDKQVTNKPTKKDASTGTPTHFIEHNIDPNYHWNEWELRRRVLKVVNLKNCVTTSQQTDLSHFKRDNETQIYLPRNKETQTKRDKGTNPPIKTTYIAGLRGKLSNDSQSISKYVVKDDVGKNKARVVTLTLDP